MVQSKVKNESLNNTHSNLEAGCRNIGLVILRAASRTPTEGLRTCVVSAQTLETISTWAEGLEQCGGLESDYLRESMWALKSAVPGPSG